MAHIKSLLSNRAPTFFSILRVAWHYRDTVLFTGRLAGGNALGGVVSITQKLAENSAGCPRLIVDFYGTQKIQVPEEVHYVVLNGSTMSRLLKLAILVSLNRHAVFYNFSMPRGLLLTLCFFHQRCSRWYLVLHHGDLSDNFEKHSELRSWLTRLALRQMYTLCAISERQESYYRSLVPEVPIELISPYVVPDVDISAEQPSLTGQSFTETDDCRVPVFLISGYPTEIYCHVEILDVFDLLASTGKAFRLSVCLYGPDTSGLRSVIEQRISMVDYASLLGAVDAQEFSKILSKTDCYIRMNTVDSYGLVVAEARDLGVEVIATNVCRRAPGTFLLESGDWEGLRSAIEVFILHGQLPDMPRSEEDTRVPLESFVQKEEKRRWCLSDEEFIRD